MATFHFNIITASGKAFEGEVDAVVLPGVDGDFGVLAGHAPLIGALRQGLIKVNRQESDLYFMVGEGYVDVARNQVSALVGEAVKVKDRITGADLLKQSNPWNAAEALNSES